MKKRLLITSIVMMLVVAVALSTATYAWFTSNTTVTANEVVLTAATMTDDAILITHNADGTEASNAITLTAHTGNTIYPATPLSSTAFTTFYNTTLEGEELTASQAANSIENISYNFQNLIMNGTGKYIAPELSAGQVSFYKDTFYVFNKSFRDTKLTPTVKIYFDPNDNTSAMAAQSARIAIIERKATAEATIGSNVPFASDAYQLKGIWQFNTTGSATEIVGYQLVANESSFVEGLDYYTVSGDVYTKDTEVTSANYADKKATLYIANKSENIAVIGANGSSTAQSGYGVADGDVDNTYIQGNVLFNPNTTFQGLGVATSGNHIANEYTVVVWLEGWDADCTNAITAGVFRVALTFEAARIQ